MPKLPSVCPLDCPDACSLYITVEDGAFRGPFTPRHPRVRLRQNASLPGAAEPPRPAAPPHAARRAERGGAFRAPFVGRSVGRHRRAATKRDCRARRGGGLALLLRRDDGQGRGEQPLAFFRALGASELDQTICATTGGAGFEANYGPGKAGPELEDVARARFVILWGINSLRSHLHPTPFLKRARAAGAHLLHIDPYGNETSPFADEHWQLIPGTDAALALSMGHVILDEGSRTPNT